jgi:predicted nucleic-acid-binding protein
MRKLEVDLEVLCGTASDPSPWQGLKPTQIVLFCYIRNLCESQSKKVVERRTPDGYTWVNYHALLEDVPCLNIGYEGLRRAMASLVESGLVEKKVIRAQKSSLCYFKVCTAFYDRAAKFDFADLKKNGNDGFPAAKPHGGKNSPKSSQRDKNDVVAPQCEKTNGVDRDKNTAVESLEREKNNANPVPDPRLGPEEKKSVANPPAIPSPSPPDTNRETIEERLRSFDKSIGVTANPSVFDLERVRVFSEEFGIDRVMIAFKRWRKKKGPTKDFHWFSEDAMEWISRVPAQRPSQVVAGSLFEKCLGCGSEHPRGSPCPICARQADSQTAPNPGHPGDTFQRYLESRAHL